MSPYRRASIEFDTIDADDADAAGQQLASLFRPEVVEPFALLRVVTTLDRFENFAGDVVDLGSWFLLRIAPADGQPGLMTWHSQLDEAGYSSHTRGLTVSAERFYPPDDDPLRRRPRSLGAAASLGLLLPTHVAQISSFLKTVLPSKRKINKLLDAIPSPSAVVVRDVGQASFVTLADATDKALIHFDVGFPISFNGHTVPKNFLCSAKEKPLVVLSHWDWDHLHAALIWPHLRDCKWIVPSQRLGPGAARVALMLAAKGNLHVWPSSFHGNFKFGSIMQSTGEPNGLNDTGLILFAKLPNKRSVLLTGDADYQFLPPTYTATDPITHLVATHHGARIKSSVAQVPSPSLAQSRLVLSYGTGNVYRHPHSEALRLHKAAGWNEWLPTAGRKGLEPRGDRKLA